MKIGLIGPTDPDSFADNIGHTLSRLGQTVDLLGPAKPVHKSRFAARAMEIGRQSYPALEARTHTKLAQQAIEARHQVVISTDATFAPEAVALLRRHGIKVALWFPDAVSNLGRMRMFAAPYTGLFFKDELLVQRLRSTLGLPIWHLPEACNPVWHRPIGQPASQKHIAVVGNTYLTRLILLERLHEDGIPIVIYGSPFPRWARTRLPASCHTGRSVRREEKSQVFRQSAAVLNNLHPAEMTSVNARLFEATAAGAAVLCERRPSLEGFYDTSREVVAFSSYDELLEQVRELLCDETRTEEIGDAASKRAHADHSYEHRLNILLETIA